MIACKYSTELHVFADASESGYGVCIYLRFVNNYKVEYKLVTSRSRVAPIKKVTIPKLELSAANWQSQWHIGYRKS